MPFTPFHMGPGLLIKGLLQGSFSLMVFGWAQIVMDIQPLVAMLTGRGAVHGFSHSWVGATLLAVVAAVTGKYLGAFGLKVLRLPTFLPIRWPVAFGSAFLGTWSHVVLDSVMHGDMAPYWPFLAGNHLLHALSVGTLHWLCIGSAVVGAVLYLGIAASTAPRGRQDPRRQ